MEELKQLDLEKRDVIIINNSGNFGHSGFEHKEKKCFFLGKVPFK